ncbi:MAG: hypothetical protein HYV19_09890 [Gemmatimonadetes bacterium]|nr:hypothetical protein [Gemmatimonadota bacterium]
MRRLLALLATVAAVLPAQQPAAPPPASAPVANAPLAQYTAVKLAVVPVQFYRGDTGFVKVPAMALRAAFDSLVSVQLEEHGLSGMWTSPAQVQRTAKRNPEYATDPRNLGAFPVRYGIAKEAMISDPLAGNLRRLVALHDTRYALMPVELRAERAAGSGRFVVRVLLIDARLMKVLFQVEVSGDSAAAYSPALLEQIATRVVELAVAP